MAVSCEILIARTEDDVFKPGDLVTGTIKYYIDEPTKFEGISMNFLGNGNCWWTKTEGGAINVGNSETYVNQSICFYTGKSGEELSGTYEYPFQFLLPINIPSSYKDGNCVIAYKIIVTFVRTTRREQFEAEIPVQGYVTTSVQEPMLFGLQKKLFPVFTDSKIALRGELENVAVTPGENVNLTIKINNDSNNEIFVRTELIKCFTLMSNHGETSANIILVPNTTTGSNIEKNSEQSIKCAVPTFVNLFSIQNSNIVKGEYKVRVTIEMPFPYKDATVDVPVVIGKIIGGVIAPDPMKNEHCDEEK
ncbi:arrestin domain-containing protein 2-like [Spodoptera frugiperda]|uniref:Arrestin domain-containing protein 2-like n=1 Tax=Spodoptera frugiperda TaxID=7108 RepID=A0A9R0EB60_SPOFR|nr:arrestin domain-containing protein 2-like [Spodoptera frugiperda]